MRNSGGYAISVGPQGTVEQDSFTCIHCNSIVFIKSKMNPSDMGGFCRMCMKPVCKNCADKKCIPFEKKLVEIEKRDSFRRSIFG